MNVMFALYSKHAFSDALESVTSKNFSRVSRTSFPLRELSQLIAYLTYKILQIVMCTQQLNYLGVFTYASLHYNQW